MSMEPHEHISRIASPVDEDKRVRQLFGSVVPVLVWENIE